MLRNIVVTTTTIAAIAIVAAAIPLLVTPAFAQFDTNNSASQSASISQNADSNNAVIGGGTVVSNQPQSASICQQIAQSGAFGSSSNSNTGCS
jgi:hypothetical protein